VPRPKLDEPPLLKRCNLLQAINWLAYDHKPYPFEFAKARGHKSSLRRHEPTETAMNDIIQLLIGGQIRSYGIKADLMYGKPFVPPSTREQKSRGIKSDIDFRRGKKEVFEEEIPAAFWRRDSMGWLWNCCWQERYTEEQEELPDFPESLADLGTPRPETQIKRFRTKRVLSAISGYGWVTIDTADIQKALNPEVSKLIETHNEAVNKGRMVVNSEFPQKVGRFGCAEESKNIFNKRAETHEVVTESLAAEARQVLKELRLLFGEKAPKQSKTVEGHIRILYRKYKDANSERFKKKISEKII